MVALIYIRKLVQDHNFPSFTEALGRQLWPSPLAQIQALLALDEKHNLVSSNSIRNLFSKLSSISSFNRRFESK